MIKRRCAIFLTPLLALAVALAGATAPSAIGATAPHAVTGSTSMIDHLDFGAFGGGLNPRLTTIPTRPTRSRSITRSSRCISSIATAATRFRGWGAP